MAWYRTGTVALTNGSPVVTGTGTAFVANVQPGHAINLPDGRAYEVLSVQSDTQLTLGNPNGYLGATANGQAYSVQPNQGFAQTAATRLADFLSQFGGYVSTVLAGLFPDGTQGRPGMAFANDQDTGLRRRGDNSAAMVAGGTDRLGWDANGADVNGRLSVNGTIGIGTNASPGLLSVAAGTAASISVGNFDIGTNNYTFGRDPSDGSLKFYGSQNAAVAYVFSGVNGEWGRFSSAGNLLVGTASGSEHTISKSVPQGSAILRLFGAGGAGTTSLMVASVSNYSPSGAGAALYVGKDSGTGRSTNAAGTINASGADYAEYMTKADGCGPIAKGDVCGVDRDGKLTRGWTQALSFMVKSTDPNLVGGDAWSRHLGPRPEDPGDAPVAPILPTAPSFGDLAIPMREPDEDNDAFAARLAEHMLVLRDAEAANAAYQAALTAFQERSAAYPGELAAFTARRDAYDRDLPVWEAALEAARATVDRIAYCGQTPVNVDADTLAACEAALDDGAAAYLVAVANGGGIGVKAVREADMTMADYMRRIGKVLRTEADRPVVDVQHG